LKKVRIHELEGQLSRCPRRHSQTHGRAIGAAQELLAARKDAQEANRELSEIREHIGSGTVDQLRREHETKIQDLVQQKRPGLSRSLKA